MKQLLKEAQMVAAFQHRDQHYDIFPYMKHIEDVVSVGRKYGFGYTDLMGCYLHDIVEDCNMSISKIKKHFGQEVAQIVADCTDPIDLPTRVEKKLMVYKKMQKAIDEHRFGSIKVKLADRIANLTHSIKTGSPQLKMYRKEYASFREGLGGGRLDQQITISKMWEELDDLIYNQ